MSLKNDVNFLWGKTDWSNILSGPSYRSRLFSHNQVSMTSNENYAVFRECLSNAIVARSEEKPKPARRKPKGKRKDVITATTVSTGRADPEELAEFVDVHCTQPSPT